MFNKKMAVLCMLICFSGCAMRKASMNVDKPVDIAALKSLEGRWETAVDATGKKETVIYKVTSGGKAVEETIFPGTPHEMVSVYYPVGNTVGMTHYCMLGNRPEFMAEKTGPNQVVFNYVDTPGINSKTDSLMNHVAMNIVDSDHVNIAWSGVKEGKSEGEAKQVQLHRVM